MPIRIYALAKELSVENKDLVDICTKAGITGKGSALASLTDEEVDRVRAYLRGASQAAKPVPSKPAPSKPVVEAPVRPSPPAVKPLEPTVKPPVKPPIKPLEPAEPAEPVRFSRDDYIAPGGSSKIRLLDSRGRKPPIDIKKRETLDEPTGEKPGVKKDEPPRKREPKETVVNLAKLPEIKQPAVQPKAAEPKPQKPDIRLPKDAIRGAKAGSRAPLEHLTAKGDKKPKPGERKKPGSEQPAVAASAKPESTLGKVGTRDRRRPKAAVGEKPAGEKPGEVDSRMGNTRAVRSKDRKVRQRPRVGGEEESTRRFGRKRLTRTRTVNTAAPRKGKVSVVLPCTVRGFSEATGVPTGHVMLKLMNMGLRLTINQQIEPEYVDLLAAELGLDIELRQPESLEDNLMVHFDQESEDPELLEPRPPVVTFLGHVDHGKTSLLDRIIGSNVVAGEAGGITQHIRAYAIEKDGRRIAFVDTPGHEAFTEMRARGANVTDIAVLVVAADDGVMPQTEEAISHAKAAGVPIVVAMNKMDLPGADENRVMQQLTAHNLLPSAWGGDVEVVPTSAITGAGINELLETLLLTADLHEYRANPNRAAAGTCLEAEQETGRGVIAKLIVQSGTLNVGDIVVCGAAHGRVKAMYDTLRPRLKVKKAAPSIPVNVTGLDVAPQAGDKFYVMDDIAKARELAQQRAARSRAQSLSGITTKVSFERFQELLEGGRIGEQEEIATLNLIIRADTQGSIEALIKELAKLHHAEVQIKILHRAVGGITTADVTLAAASQAVIVGFNVIPDEAARSLADEWQVEIRRYEVIYKIADDIKAMLEGRLKPEERVVDLGHALVKQVFPISRVGTIAGCYVAQGSIERGCRIRVNREGRTIGDYPLESLKREKDDTREVPRGMECGIKLSGFNDLKIGDILEAYKIEEVARTL